MERPGTDGALSWGHQIRNQEVRIMTEMTKKNEHVAKNSKKTLGERFRDYMKASLEWYGEMYSRVGYRNMFF